ncbi:hypothetical protein KEM54_003559 [Ascosphaera aggregata]|nr:hypothetical protein KEM54_003559 [Ascosphaera aggregata]
MPTPAVSPELKQPKLESVQDVGIEQKKVSGLTQLPLRIGHLFQRTRSHMKRPKSLHIETGLKEYTREDQSAPAAINPLSPGQKRRRPSQDMEPGQPRVLRSPISPPASRFSHANQRRLNRPHSYSMILPPPPQVYATNSSTGLRGISQHQSLHFKPAIQPPPLHPNDRERAEIRGIPFLNKIKLLSVIAPPAGAEPKNLDAIEIPCLARKRGGALIAVEGEDPEAVHFMIRHLVQTLAKGDDQVVKVFNGPEVSTSHPPPREDLSLQYLNIISAWRKISYQIVDFISGSHGTGDMRSPFLGCALDFGNDTTRMPSIQEIMKQSQDAKMSEASEVSAQWSNASVISAADAALLSQQGQELRQPFRIALVPRYQFTNAEKYACTAPINDSYTPHDHWQWMASLWRYCAGPDLTIYVRDCGLQELYENNSNENPVDVRLDIYRTLIVRRGRSETGAVTSVPPIEEKALRRVTFEVGEYFRR